jgi:peptide/nickel transport system substrate-binding protein
VPVSLDSEGPELGHEPSDEGMAQVYEPLVEYKYTTDSSGARVPDYAAGFQGRLAQSWTVSPDGLTYTFDLRKGVKSYWGNELTADDVIWSVQRAFALKAVGTFFLQVGGVQSASDVKKIDQYTVQYHIKTPTKLFMLTKAYFLAPIYDAVEAKKFVTASDPWASNWISKNGGGFGPYYVSSWQPGHQFVLQANPNYYRGVPRLKTITIEAVPSDATRLAALETGSVDIAEALTPREVDSLKGNSGVKIMDVLPGNRNEWLILNTSWAPLKDPRVRQAIAYALPYASIINSVFLGRATIYKNVVPLGYPDVTTQLWHFDTNIAKAKELMSAAGYPHGFAMTMNYSAGFPEDDQVGELLKNALSQIGINVTLAKVSPAIFSTMKVTQAERLKTNILLSSADVSWIPDYTYAAGYFFTSTAPFNPVWKDPHFDALAAQASVERNEAKRHALILQMQQILLTQLPYVPIVMTGLPVAMRSNVQGYTWYPDDFMRFVNMYKT